MNNQYNFLNSITDLPKMIKIGLDNLGIKEVVGNGSNKTIMSWAHELGMLNTYSNDEIPWCGLFVAMVVKRSGRDPVVNPLWARNWQTFGQKASTAMLGDVLVFKRQSGGHVGFYIAEDRNCYHVLGGNQSNAVTISRIEKSRCIAIRRPVYQNQPASVKQYILSATGSVSHNEA